MSIFTLDLEEIPDRVLFGEPKYNVELTLTLIGYLTGNRTNKFNSYVIGNYEYHQISINTITYCISSYNREFTVNNLLFTIKQDVYCRHLGVGIQAVIKELGKEPLIPPGNIVWINKEHTFSHSSLECSQAPLYTGTLYKDELFQLEKIIIDW